MSAAYSSSDMSKAASLLFRNTYDICKDNRIKLVLANCTPARPYIGNSHAFYSGCDDHSLISENTFVFDREKILQHFGKKEGSDVDHIVTDDEKKTLKVVDGEEVANKLLQSRVQKVIVCSREADEKLVNQYDLIKLCHIAARRNRNTAFFVDLTRPVQTKYGPVMLRDLLVSGNEAHDRMSSCLNAKNVCLVLFREKCVDYCMQAAEQFPKFQKSMERVIKEDINIENIRCHDCKKLPNSLMHQCCECPAWICNDCMIAYSKKIRSSTLENESQTIVQIGKNKFVINYPCPDCRMLMSLSVHFSPKKKNDKSKVSMNDANTTNGQHWKRIQNSDDLSVKRNETRRTFLSRRDNHCVTLPGEN